MRVTKPSSVGVRLELSEFAHVEAIAIAQCEKLPQVVFAGTAFQANDQSPITFAMYAGDAWYPLKPFEVGSLIGVVIEDDAGVHLVQRK